MSEILSYKIIQTKRTRGGQPGNRNSKGNRCNCNARGIIGNSGGKGASFGNQYALKLRTLATELFRDYANNAEVLIWLEQNREDLAKVEIRSDVVLDKAMFKGISLDRL
jgi:hypothetical protein